MRTVSLKERISEKVAAPRMPGRISGSSTSTNCWPVRAAHPGRLEIDRIEGGHVATRITIVAKGSAHTACTMAMATSDGGMPMSWKSAVARPALTPEQWQKHERQDQPGRGQLANGHHGEHEGGAIRATIPPTSSDVTIALVSTGFRHIWAYREEGEGRSPPHPSRPRRRAAAGAADR